MSYNIPDTSKAAHARAKQGLIDSHKAKVLAAIQKLKLANYEAIAQDTGLDKHAVGRRLKELEGEQKIYKPGSKSKTASGCKAYDYAILPNQTETGNLYLNQTSAAEHAAEIIKLTQGTLFQTSKTVKL